MNNDQKAKDKQGITLLAEINTLKFPITALDKRHRKAVEIHWKSPDGSREIEWRLASDRIPGPRALKIQRCLETIIRHLLKENKLTIENRRFEYSLAQIENMLGLDHGKHTYKELKQHIKDLIFLQIVTTSTLWDFAGHKYYEFIEPVRIYERGAFVGDEIDGKIVERSFLEVSEWYLRNIIAGFTKPLLPFYRKLSPTAARLYEILSLHASDTRNIIETKRIFSEQVRDYVTIRHVSIDYWWLCERMPISPQRDRYLALKKLEKAHKELTNLGYIYESELDEQWQLNYWLGELADEEIKKRREYISQRKSKPVSGGPKPEVKQITIRYHDSNCQVVKIAGEFNNWEPEAMEKVSQELWQKVLNLNSGNYKYKLIVDGSWVSNPEGQFAGDEYGNNIIEVS